MPAKAVGRVFLRARPELPTPPGPAGVWHLNATAVGWSPVEGGLSYPGAGPGVGEPSASSIIRTGHVLAGDGRCASACLQRGGSARAGPENEDTEANHKGHPCAGCYVSIGPQD